MSNIVTTESKKFSFRINSNATIKKVKGTTNTVQMESQATALSIPVEEISVTDKNKYTVTLDMNNYTYSLMDSLKIVIMGSSVASGAGATNDQGCNYLYAKILAKRAAENNGRDWNVVNKSVGGNNTQKLMDRWDRDLVSQHGRYVIYGLSLGNEGIHGSTNQQVTFNHWVKNMQGMITASREKGMVPVVANNYTRGDFTASDYAYIKKVNLLIHEWDVPSINLLGAIDNGAGKWAAGYENDNAHPNTFGHMEFSYAMVPSLFDALQAGKPQPQRANGTYITFDNTKTINQLEFIPDNTIHPFTISFDVKTTGHGTIALIKQGLVYGSLKIAPTGVIVYQSPNGEQIKGKTAVNDGKWHKITLTYFHARNETILYSDANEVGKLEDILLASAFYLNDIDSPTTISYRDLFFYRSGMNGDEIAALNNGRMLKSSLELYAPLDGQGILGTNPLVNLAQSTNIVTMNKR